MYPIAYAGMCREDASCPQDKVLLLAPVALNVREVALAAVSMELAGCNRSCMALVVVGDLSPVSDDSTWAGVPEVLSWGCPGTGSPGVAFAVAGWARSHQIDRKMSDVDVG
jgi:hypothetical protein